MNLTIKEIYEELDDINNEIVENEGVSSPELQARLNLIDLDDMSLLRVYGAKFKDLLDEITINEQRIKLLEDKNAKLTKAINYFENVTIKHMESLNKKRLNCDNFELSISKSKTIVMTDKSLIPSQYIETVITTKTDIKYLMKDMKQLITKNKITIPGVNVITKKKIKINS